MAGHASSSDEELFSGINVTPLVDVVLVLLIIFLITAPTIYQSAIKVQLPKAASGDENQRSPLGFTLTRDGGLYWGRERIEWGSLTQRLGALGEQCREETAVISADEVTPHGTVIRLMDSLRAAGLTRIALTVESKSPPPKAEGGVRAAAADGARDVQLAANWK
jgi:biopolymer transport protein ExbD